jgi:hypothetical protein
VLIFDLVLLAPDLDALVAEAAAWLSNCSFRYTASKKGSMTSRVRLFQGPRVLFLTVLVCLSASAARADCAFPSAAGVVICQPSPGSTVFRSPHIEVAATPVSGSIIDLKVLIDGKLVFENSGAQLNLFEGGVTNGLHQLTIQTQDNFGRTLQAQESFSVIGNTPFSCPVSGSGVKICAPAPGDFVDQNLFFSVGFKTQSPASHLRVYIDNKDFADFSPPFGFPNQLVASAGAVSAGNHTMAFVVWDTKGRVQKQVVSFHAFFDGGCPPKGNICTPVLAMNTPQDGDDVSSPFRVSGQVEFNSVPISAIKAYLDGKQVGESFGPVFDQKISAAKGTHILELQGWDSEGRLYRVTENVNVQ